MKNYYNIEIDTIRNWQPQNYYLIVGRRMTGKTFSTWMWLIKSFIGVRQEKFLLVLQNFNHRRCVEYTCSDLNFQGVISAITNFKYNRICFENNTILLVNATKCEKTVCGYVEYEYNITANSMKLFALMGIKNVLYDDYLPENFENTMLKWFWYKVTMIVLLHRGWLKELRSKAIITEAQFQFGGTITTDFNGVIEVTR